MSEESDNSREFQPDEVQLIVRRVAELQVIDGHHETRCGLTRKEIEGAVSEAGLDARLVRRAIADVEARSKHKYRRLMGFGTSVAVQRNLPFELQDSAFEMAIAELNRQFGVIGEHEIVRKSLTWSGRYVTTTVASRAGATMVQLEEQFFRRSIDKWVGVTVSGASGSVFGGLMAGAAAASVGALVALPVYGLLRVWHKHELTTTIKHLEVSADQLVSLLSSSQARLQPVSG